MLLITSHHDDPMMKKQCNIIFDLESITLLMCSIIYFLIILSFSFIILFFLTPIFKVIYPLWISNCTILYISFSIYSYFFILLILFFMVFLTLLLNFSVFFSSNFIVLLILFVLDASEYVFFIFFIIMLCYLSFNVRIRMFLIVFYILLHLIFHCFELFIFLNYLFRIFILTLFYFLF